DYIERLIQECARALSRILALRRAGDVDPALRAVDEAATDLLGPLRPIVERLEATTAVAMAGPNERGRVRMYAALLGEEGLIHRAAGDTARAYLSCRRALELYAAVSLAGARLDDADRGRIAVLGRTVDVEELDARYRDELSRILGRGRAAG
ncbi:MAG TPA: hypothetical protein VGO86_13735, partial [Candidatus Dormibacteraeota bacterium]